MADLDSYNVVVRDPAVTQYRDFTVYGMGLPSSGGLTVGLILNMLEGSDLGALPRPGALYRMRALPTPTGARTWATRTL